MTTPYANTPPDELRESIAVALTWHDPSRFVIGDMLRALRQHGGEEAVQDAIPADDPKAARLAVKCLRVADRWPEDARGRWPDLEWGHFHRVRWLDDEAAGWVLDDSQANGWTPAQLGRHLAGFATDEPAVSAMAQRLADDAGGRLVYEAAAGEWRVEGQAAWQPSMGAAVRAAWRGKYGQVTP